MRAKRARKKNAPLGAQTMQKMMFLSAETPKFSACGEPKRAIFPYKNLILPLKTPKIFRLRRAQTGPDRIWGSYYFEFLNKSRIGGLIILSFQNNLGFGGLIEGGGFIINRTVVKFH